LISEKESDITINSPDVSTPGLFFKQDIKAKAPKALKAQCVVNKSSPTLAY
jgi:hypothetical protein